MKILYLNPVGCMGGAERALLDLMASLREANPLWKLSLIAGSDGQLVEEARELGVAAMVLPFPPIFATVGDARAGGPGGNQTRAWAMMMRLGAASPGLAMYNRKLARAISDAAPDLVHTNGFKMHLLGAWATPPRLPLLWHIHDFVRARPLMSRLLRRYVRRCTAIVVNSECVACDVRAALGECVPANILYNAVDLERFSPEGPKLDLDRLANMAPADSGVVRVGLVATMARWKGHGTFLRAISMLPREVPLRGYVIGGPIYQTVGSQYTIEELREQAKRLGITDRIGFTGFVRDSAAAMRALDIVVHASVAPEPFGLVIAEAFACGRAVIASATCGAAELIAPGETALIHRQGDAAELTNLLGRLAADSELRGRLGLAARKTAERQFERTRLAAQLTPIYQELAVNAAA